MAYEKKTWVCGETIEAADLNHMEDGIESASGGGGGSAYNAVLLIPDPSESGAPGDTVHILSGSFSELVSLWDDTYAQGIPKEPPVVLVAIAGANMGGIVTGMLMVKIAESVKYAPEFYNYIVIEATMHSSDTSETFVELHWKPDNTVERITI